MGCHQFRKPGMLQKASSSERTSQLPWLIASLSVVTSAVFALLFTFSTPGGATLTLDFLGKLFGPIGAALIAWAGVNQTVNNAKRLDQSKEWYTNLRWATELCSSNEESAVEMGVAVLDALDDLPFLSKEQQVMIDKLLKKTALGHDEVNDIP